MCITSSGGLVPLRSSQQTGAQVFEVGFCPLQSPVVIFCSYLTAKCYQTAHAWTHKIKVSVSSARSWAN